MSDRIGRIRAAVHYAAHSGHRIAMFHYQVLRNADFLAELDPIAFCHDVAVRETYVTEFRKMLSLARLMREQRAVIIEN